MNLKEQYFPYNVNVLFPLLHKYLLNAYYVADTVLGTGLQQ